MNTIYTIPGVSLASGGARDAGFRQGDLDGACGPYAVMTALVASGVLTRRAVIELYDDTPDRRTAFAKAWSSIPALVQSGTHADHLIALALGVSKTLKIGEKLSPKRLDTRAKHLIADIVQRLNETKRPIILRLDWKGKGAHWSVVVGYATSCSGDPPSHLLLIDPGYKTSDIQLWNAILTVTTKRGPKPYKYEVNGAHNEPTFCQVTDAIVLK